MQLLKPQSIAPEIMNLMEDAKEFMIIVSPYNKVANWRKLAKSIDKLKRNNVRVEYYIREDNKDGYTEVKAIGFVPLPIPNLHTKFYMNESSGIVTSMNLHESSDDNSLDIGYKTENRKEYEELYTYYTDNISHFNKSVSKSAVVRGSISATVAVNNRKADEIQLEFFRHLEYELKRQLKEYPVNREAEKIYRIGSRTMEVDFQRGRQHQYVNVNSILTCVLFDFFAPQEASLQRQSESNLSFVDPGKGAYNYFQYSFRTPDKVPVQFTNEEIRLLVSQIVKVQAVLWETARRKGDKKVNDNVYYQR